MSCGPRHGSSPSVTGPADRTLDGSATDPFGNAVTDIVASGPDAYLTAAGVEESASIMVLGAGLNVTQVINAGPQIDGEGAAIGKTPDATGVGGNPSAVKYRPLVVADGLLIGATFAPSNGGGNPLVAIDLRTGKTRWVTAVRGDDIFVPVAVTVSTATVIGVSQGGTGNRC
jgi:hypothetical protein